jgi:A-kinase anchor protein 9
MFSAVTQATTELIHTHGESGFFGELEALRAESVTNKEFASYKEKAEKLQEELLVR